ncbi:MAG: helix-turn-helix transcriptional regulator [Dehalococcoidia bacterium]|nr:helix-turn-helix transcriptional regulator [Dehalococcoidia bacterium]
MARTAPSPGLDELTAKQREVLRMIAAGRTNPEIATALGVTIDGAKWHVREILSKLSVPTREEAAAIWREEHSAGARLQRAARAATSGAVVRWALAAGGAALGLAAIVALVLAISEREDSTPIAVDPSSSPTPPASTATPVPDTPAPATPTPATATATPVPAGGRRLVFTPTSGPCDTPFTATAEGFEPGAEVHLSLATMGESPIRRVAIADSSGQVHFGQLDVADGCFPGARIRFVAFVPGLAPHEGWPLTEFLADQVGTFRVVPASGTCSSPLTVTGDGLPPGLDLEINWMSGDNGANLGFAQTDATGSFATQVPLPGCPEGTLLITAFDRNYTVDASWWALYESRAP